jgi:hypothetical protein
MDSTKITPAATRMSSAQVEKLRNRLVNELNLTPTEAANITKIFELDWPDTESWIKIKHLEISLQKLVEAQRQLNKTTYVKEKVEIGAPRFAQFVLLLIPKHNREHLVGDLEEEFNTVVLPQHGRFLARCWYFEQVMLAVGFYLWPTIKKILGLSVFYKLIGR